MAHLTISQDQTSSSQFSRERLAALLKQSDEAELARVGLISIRPENLLRAIRTSAKLLDQMPKHLGRNVQILLSRGMH